MDSRKVLGRTSEGMVYEYRGGGSPVVLLHGWCLSAQIWIYLAETLARDHQVFCPDLPGFGRSSDLAGPYDFGRHSNSVAEMLAELDLADAVIVGFAYGAGVAMTLASAARRRMRGIVSIGVPSAAAAPYERMPRAMRKDWPDFALRSARAICRQPQSDATLAWLAEIFSGTPLPVAIESVAALGSFEPVEIAADVAVESLFVHGADDDVVPPSVSAECAELAPRGRLELIEDSGHFVVLDQRERLAGVVQGFIDGTAHGAPRP